MALLSTGTTGTILTILYFVYKLINGRKLHSKCCDKDIEIGMQVENMTPPIIHIPQQQINHPQQFKVNPIFNSRDKNG